MASLTTTTTTTTTTTASNWTTAGNNNNNNNNNNGGNNINEDDNVQAVIDIGDGFFMHNNQIFLFVMFHFQGFCLCNISNNVKTALHIFFKHVTADQLQPG